MVHEHLSTPNKTVRTCLCPLRMSMEFEGCCRFRFEFPSCFLFVDWSQTLCWRWRSELVGNEPSDALGHWGLVDNEPFKWFDALWHWVIRCNSRRSRRAMAFEIGPYRTRSADSFCSLDHCSTSRVELSAIRYRFNSPQSVNVPLFIRSCFRVFP